MIGSGDVALLLERNTEPSKADKPKRGPRSKEPRKKGDPTEEEGDLPANEPQRSV